MSHDEFLVTPETARPYAAFNQKELATVTATTIANALIAKAAAAGIRSAQQAIQQRRLEGLRRQIASELAAIEAANAGCPRPDNVLPNSQHATPVACPSSPDADGSNMLTGER